jgi:hypothetical protein
MLDATALAAAHSMDTDGSAFDGVGRSVEAP